MGTIFNLDFIPLSESNYPRILDTIWKHQGSMISFYTKDVMTRVLVNDSLLGQGQSYIWFESGEKKLSLVFENDHLLSSRMEGCPNGLSDFTYVELQSFPQRVVVEIDSEGVYDILCKYTPSPFSFGSSRNDSGGTLVFGKDFSQNSVLLDIGRLSNPLIDPSYFRDGAWSIDGEMLSLSLTGAVDIIDDMVEFSTNDKTGRLDIVNGGTFYIYGNSQKGVLLSLKPRRGLDDTLEIQSRLVGCGDLGMKSFSTDELQSFPSFFHLRWNSVTLPTIFHLKCNTRLDVEDAWVEDTIEFDGSDYSKTVVFPILEGTSSPSYTFKFEPVSEESYYFIKPNVWKSQGDMLDMVITDHNTVSQINQVGLLINHNMNITTTSDIVLFDNDNTRLILKIVYSDRDITIQSILIGTNYGMDDFTRSKLDLFLTTLGSLTISPAVDLYGYTSVSISYHEKLSDYNIVQHNIDEILDSNEQVFILGQCDTTNRDMYKLGTHYDFSLLRNVQEWQRWFIGPDNWKGKGQMFEFTTVNLPVDEYNTLTTGYSVFYSDTITLQVDDDVMTIKPSLNETINIWTSSDGIIKFDVIFSSNQVWSNLSHGMNELTLEQLHSFPKIIKFSWSGMDGERVEHTGRYNRWLYSMPNKSGMATYSLISQRTMRMRSADQIKDVGMVNLEGAVDAPYNYRKFTFDTRLVKSYTTQDVARIAPNTWNGQVFALDSDGNYQLQSQIVGIPLMAIWFERVSKIPDTTETTPCITGMQYSLNGNDVQTISLVGDTIPPGEITIADLGGGQTLVLEYGECGAIDWDVGFKIVTFFQIVLRGCDLMNVDNLQALPDFIELNLEFIKYNPYSPSTRLLCDTNLSIEHHYSGFEVNKGDYIDLNTMSSSGDFVFDVDNSYQTTYTTGIDIDLAKLYNVEDMILDLWKTDGDMFSLTISDNGVYENNYHLIIDGVGQDVLSSVNTIVDIYTSTSGKTFSLIFSDNTVKSKLSHPLNEFELQEIIKFPDHINISWGTTDDKSIHIAVDYHPYIDSSERRNEAKDRTNNIVLPDDLHFIQIALGEYLDPSKNDLPQDGDFSETYWNSSCGFYRVVFEFDTSIVSSNQVVGFWLGGCSEYPGMICHDGLFSIRFDGTYRTCDDTLWVVLDDDYSNSEHNIQIDTSRSTSSVEIFKPNDLFIIRCDVISTDEYFSISIGGLALSTEGISAFPKNIKLMWDGATDAPMYTTYTYQPIVGAGSSIDSQMTGIYRTLDEVDDYDENSFWKKITLIEG